jgi:predicted lipoprotein with Yx(FWY)xxD motif
MRDAPDAIRHLKRILVTLVACSVLAAGCGSDDEGDTGMADQAPAAGETAAEAARTGSATAEADTATESAPPAVAKRRRGARLTLRDSQFGPVLFDGRNRALYLFTRDPRNKTRCYGACAEAWPPFYAKGRPRAGRRVDRSLLGTIKRRDGRRQVTYKGQALYFYVDDPRGEVLCNDVFEFGGTWYAVDAKGNPPG